MKWRMQKTEAKSAEIMIYGDISTYNWWEDDGVVTPQQFNKDLQALGEDIDVLNVRINSNGGSVFAGVAIHSMLKRHKAKVVVYVDGIAASIASIIAMAGDEIVMPKGAMLMVHHPWTYGMGNAKDFRKLADDLDAISNSMQEIYVARTGIDSDELIALLDGETWLSATQAVEKGFANRIEENSQTIAASIRSDGKTAIINGVEMDWSRFKNAPTLPDEKKQPTSEPTQMSRDEISSMVADIVKGLIPSQDPQLNKLEPDALDNDPGVFLLRKKLELKNKTI